MTVKKFIGGAKAVQTWRVPPLVTQITIDAYGAVGGVDDGSTAKGGRAQGILAVTPGETLYVYVGSRGAVARNPSGFVEGGFNGGGAAGTGSGDGTGGGGASDVRQGGNALSNRKIVAGGGGGRPFAIPSTSGSGGGTTGGAGAGSAAGGGGTPSAGGAYTGTGGGGTAGSSGQGGHGGNNGVHQGAGGGGGGYFGGGGGGLDTGTGLNPSGGGGGSSYLGGVTGSSTTANVTSPGTPHGQVIFTYNTPPNFATQSAPTGGQYTDRSAATALTWVFSDNDLGEAQSAADIRYRIVGTGTWTTVTTAVTGTGNTYSITAATLTAGSQYEWQVQTYDTSNAASGWSPSALFTPVTPPSTPTWVSPASGSTITTDPLTYDWTPSGTQAGYQLQVCGDSAGTINTSVVYYDTGTVVTSTSALAVDVTPPGNGVTVHVQVRYFVNAGVWSPYSERGAQLINLGPLPGVPTVVLAQDLTLGRVSIAITNPGSPAVTVINTIYRTVGSQPEALLMANVAPNATVFDGRVPFGYTVRYRVVAFAASGGQTSST